MIVCGWPLSSKAKSSGPRLEIGFPELLVTSTSRLMRPSTESVPAPVCAHREAAQQRTNTDGRRLEPGRYSSGPFRSQKSPFAEAQVVALPLDTQILLKSCRDWPLVGGAVRWAASPNSRRFVAGVSWRKIAITLKMPGNRDSDDFVSGVATPLEKKEPPRLRAAF